MSNKNNEQKYADYLPFSLIKFLALDKQNDWQKNISFVMI